MEQIANFPDVLDVRFQECFWKEYNALELTYQKYMGIKNTSRNYEKLTGVYNNTTFPKLGENETVSVSTIKADYDSTFTPDRYSDSKQVSKDLLDDDQFNVIEQQAKALARGAKFRLNERCAEIFTYGFSATDKEGDGLLAKDGKRIFSTLHDKNESEAATDYSNADAAGRILSESNLETLKQQLRLTLGPDGKLMYLTPNVLITSTKNEKVAKILLGSQLRPDTADNDINVYYGSGMDLIILPELDDAISGVTGSDDYWFLADKTQMKDIGALLYMREQPNFASTSPEYHSRNRYWEWVMDMRFARGVYEWRPLCGSKGDSAVYSS